MLEPVTRLVRWALWLVAHVLDAVIGEVLGEVVAPFVLCAIIAGLVAAILFLFNAVGSI